MLQEGRATLPIAVAAQPIAVDDPRAGFVYARTDEAGFHRLWAAALFHRSLDGYDATLLLWESGLDTEARAHCRIAFEHMLNFAWVVADRTDITRPLRIDRHGAGFTEKQVAEMASHTSLSERRPYQVGLALGVNTSDLPPPPGAQDLCSLLDDELLPRLEAMARTGMSFIQRLVLPRVPRSQRVRAFDPSRHRSPDRACARHHRNRAVASAPTRPPRDRRHSIENGAEHRQHSGAVAR